MNLDCPKVQKMKLLLAYSDIQTQFSISAGLVYSITLLIDSFLNVEAYVIIKYQT